MPIDFEIKVKNGDDTKIRRFFRTVRSVAVDHGATFKSRYVGADFAEMFGSVGFGDVKVDELQRPAFESRLSIEAAAQSLSVRFN